MNSPRAPGERFLGRWPFGPLQREERGVPKHELPTPPFMRVLVRLRFTRPARFHFLHGGAINGLLCRALEIHPLPAGLIPFAPEAGRVRFEPGDPYHLGLTLVGEARQLLLALVAGLARLGQAQPDRSQPLPTLGGNFIVEDMQELPPPPWDEDLAALAQAKEVRLRFVSPLRMTRPSAAQKPGETFYNADCFPVQNFLGRLWGRLFRLAQGREASQEEPPIPADAEAPQRQLFWLDLPVPGKAGARRPRPGGLTLGGVVGTLTLSGLSAPWLEALLLGSHLHVGEGISYGLGRFRLEVPGLAPDPFQPARTFLDQASQPETLLEALRHVVRHAEGAGVDGELPAAVAEREQEVVASLARELAQGGYRPQPLLGLLLPKDDGGVRPLAIPTIRDRVVQRAACQVLSEAVDTLLEDSSYAYRRGLSRAAAAVAIQRAYEEGYRWVLDADVEAFFDCVDWERLFAKLEAFFPGEPLVALLKQWVTAPVAFQGRLLERRQGLPQGAAVSPLLANLYLDQLDEELARQGFRLVRYADDFLVLCRDRESALRAQEAAKQALAELGLSLNPEKTAIVSFDEGFSYLGYLFCRSLVVEKKRPKAEFLPEDLDPKAIPANSWLASIPLENLREAMAQRPRPEPKARAPEPQPLPEAAPALRPLYITDPAATLAVQQEKLLINSPTAGLQELGLRTVSHVVFVGRVRATVHLLLTLHRLGIPCYFCRRTGELYAQFLPYGPHWTLWQAQAAKAADPAISLAFSRALVQAKLHNAATLAVRLKLQGCGELAQELRELEARALQQTSLEGLRGVEGRGAARFFAALAQSLPQSWGFSSRRRNPPPDPINAMLSFGYTILYQHLTTALVAVGLHPHIGFYHTGRGTHCALASDLLEEFRHLAEAHVIALVRRREVSPNDFVASSDGRYPCLLTAEARRRFIVAFERRLLTEFTPPGGSEPMSYLAFMHQQASQVRLLVEERIGAYEPLRLHA